LKDEFPRESYTIITKTGKYGPTVKDHIYDPEVTKKGVERSLKRFNTDYLDAVCKSIV
jgi:aryl-alcohol dehydrogenase-like predicted oxidoreductase